MSSMRIDCDRVRIGTREELERYMDGSAASVGRIMASILRARHERDGFARLGVAFQLTNFVRDVGEDYRLDRVYLPAVDRARMGVSERDLSLASATVGLRKLVAAEVERARRLFAETEPVVASALPSARRSIAFARTVYLAVLDEIEAVDYDVLATRIQPRLRHLARATFGPRVSH